MNLFLIGYRCSGKTATGKRLALKTGRAFADTDDEIVKEYGRSIRALVNKNGWESFREKEGTIIREICERNHLVVATGGGAILDPGNIIAMKKSGKLIWLKAGPESVRKRIESDDRTEGLRPSLTSRGLVDEIEDMLIIRNPLYEAAMDFYVNTDNRGIDEVCRLIIKQVDALKGERHI